MWLGDLMGSPVAGGRELPRQENRFMVWRGNGYHKRQEAWNGERCLTQTRILFKRCIRIPKDHDLREVFWQERGNHKSLARRKPITPPRSPGLSQLRIAERMPQATQTQEPPRNTRFSPHAGPVGSVTWPVG
jgi:hypothetical protein